MQGESHCGRLSGDQEDKLVPLRTLQEGLYTLLHTRLLSTLVMLLSHALTHRYY